MHGVFISPLIKFTQKYGLVPARNAGKRVAYLDFQQLNNSVLNDEELFFRHFCSWISDELELEDKVEEYFNRNLTTIQRCDRPYMPRGVFPKPLSPNLRFGATKLRLVGA
ncbi:hypothetical protein DP113_21915 [Brasilonema octagenarum UFV-E1]|uniref:Uncharacterized protein n=1 Tax=Brasilonema sennae CENA114 TaxID=415709 RepID=A0A856MIW2_9CYAN|nr:AAA-like domain-containing protein [Brasilonema sennae]QDL10209.1 hypothetical protein DP114_21995 [Brasilonema sennae CENA114]QDL16561.1 hypothetical protein DP113_21915 [Brasilonema octagenarum UFV-E1]